MIQLRARPPVHPTPTPPTVEGPGSPLLVLLAAVASLAGALLYLNALHNPFVYDDYRLIVENPALLDLSNLRRIVLRDVLRPVVSLSYALDTAIWGIQPFGYHLTSVLLHAVNVSLVFRVVLLACEDRLQRQNQSVDQSVDQSVGTAASPVVAAFCAALLFAVHPMMSQAVGYVAARSELAYGSLFLLAFLAGRRWMLTASRRWWMACAGLWLAALLAKETAIMLPFVLMAYGGLVLGPPPEPRRRLLVMALPFLVLTIVAVVGRVAVLGFVEYQVRWFDSRFILAAAETLWRYLALFLRPHEQALFHAVDVSDTVTPLRIAAIIGILVLPFALWRLQRFHSLIAFGGSWFLLLLLPSCALFAVGIGEPFAEHRGYLAAVGLFLAGGSSFAMLWERTSGRTALRVAVVTVAALFVAQLSLRTYARNEIWSDPVLLAQESVALAPDQWIPWMLLGEALRRTDRCDEAIGAYRKVFTLQPQEKSAYPVLGICLIELHRFDEARALMLELRTLDPASPDAPVALGMLAMLEDDLASARAYFTEALDHRPDLASAGVLLGFVSGTLPPGERRQVCDDFRAMAGGVDLAACVAREPGPSPSLEAPDRPVR